MLTYSNANMLSSDLHRKMGNVFLRRAAAYASQRPTEDFVTIEDFLMGTILQLQRLCLNGIAVLKKVIVLLLDFPTEKGMSAKYKLS